MLSAGSNSGMQCTKQELTLYDGINPPITFIGASVDLVFLKDSKVQGFWTFYLTF